MLCIKMSSSEIQLHPSELQQTSSPPPRPYLVATGEREKVMIERKNNINNKIKDQERRRKLFLLHFCWRLLVASILPISYTGYLSILHHPAPLSLVSCLYFFYSILLCKFLVFGEDIYLLFVRSFRTFVLHLAHLLCESKGERKGHPTHTSISLLNTWRPR